MAGENRKERRAKQTAKKTLSSGTSFHTRKEIDNDTMDYLLQHPDRSGPKGKTLFELADERQRELDKSKSSTWIANNRVNDITSSPADDIVAVGPVGDAILYSMSMAALHLTFDVIVYSQYREDIVWTEIFERAATATPVFTMLVYLTHVDFSFRFPVLRNVIFSIGSVVAGSYLVFSGNKHGYFHVMQAAPPLGTLWIWSVVEMSLPYAASSALIVLLYSLWNGFEFY